MPANNNSAIAAGTINPMRFLQAAPGLQGQVLQCTGAGVEIIGVAPQWTNNLPGTPWAPAQGYPVANAGQQLEVIGDGRQTLLIVGSGQTVLPGMDLGSDASGNALPITLGSTAVDIGARSEEGGVAGDPIRVNVTLRPRTRT
jgi:hypothetical protein